MSQPIRGQGGHPVFLISPKKHKLGRGHWDLASCQFYWNPFSGFREEVENVSANQRPGRPSCFSDWPEKHKLGRRRWDLASCQVLLKSIQQFQRRRRKCEKLTTDGRRTTQDGQRVITIVHLSLRLRCTNKRPKGPHIVHLSKICHHFCLLIVKNTKLVDDVEILLPVKFFWIPFSGLRGKVENVSANQRPGQPSCFSNRPKKHKLGKGHWHLASCQRLVWFGFLGFMSI